MQGTILRLQYGFPHSILGISPQWSWRENYTFASGKKKIIVERIKKGQLL